MRYPSFYDKVEPIRLYDPLSEFLGASEKGLIEISYLECVKLAGHSCPTVAGAYLMAAIGLGALYGDTTPVRGGIEVSLREPLDEGVTGVTGNVLGFITGAGNEGGFKGIGGNFSRKSLLHYGADIGGEVMLRRTDTGRAVILGYDPSSVPPDPRMRTLMAQALGGSTSDGEKQLFGELWQARVEKILLDISMHEGMVTVREV